MLRGTREIILIFEMEEMEIPCSQNILEKLQMFLSNFSQSKDILDQRNSTEVSNSMNGPRRTDKKDKKGVKKVCTVGPGRE